MDHEVNRPMTDGPSSSREVLIDLGQPVTAGHRPAGQHPHPGRPSGRSKLKSRWHIRWATLILATAGVLSLTVWYAAASALGDALHVADTSAFNETRSSATPADQITFGTARMGYPVAPTVALVTLHVERLSLSDRRIHGTVFIHVPAELMANFVDMKTGQAIKPEALIDLYAPTKISILIIGGTDPDMTLTQTLDNLTYHHDEPGIPAGLYGMVGAISLGVTGVAGRFPLDSYRLSVAMVPYLPDQIGYQTGGHTYSSLPTQMRATLDTDIGDYSLVKARFRTSQFTSLWLERARGAEMFTYAVAFMPLLLALVLAHLIWAHELDVTDTLKLLFAALFTILTLRVVLVPTDIGSLTLLDNLLGAEVMLLLMVGAVAYWRDIWQRHRPSRRRAAGIPEPMAAEGSQGSRIATQNPVPPAPAQG